MYVHDIFNAVGKIKGPTLWVPIKNEVRIKIWMEISWCFLLLCLLLLLFLFFLVGRATQTLFRAVARRGSLPLAAMEDSLYGTLSRW